MKSKMENNQQILEELLGIDLKIDFTLLKDIKFNDHSLEEKFISNSGKKEKQKKLFTDIILIGGYFIFLLQTLVSYHGYKFLFMYLLFLFASIIIWIISCFIKSNTIRKILDHLQIFFFSFNLNLKAILLTLEYNQLAPDTAEKYETEIIVELLRTITYEFMVTNMLLLLKLEGKFITHLFFAGFNLITIIVCQIKLKANFNTYLDGLGGILYSIIFYLFRRLWEYKLRIIFAEKYKFENLFLYTNDFIQGLNGYHLNFKNNYLVCYDDKFYKFLNENLTFDDKNNCNKDIIINKDLIDKLKRKSSFPIRNNSKKKGKKFEEIHLPNCNNSSNNENVFNSYLKNFDLRETNPLTFFLEQLIRYENTETPISKILPLINEDSNNNNFSDLNFINNKTNNNENNNNNNDYKNNINLNLSKNKDLEKNEIHKKRINKLNHDPRLNFNNNKNEKEKNNENKITLLSIINGIQQNRPTSKNNFEGINKFENIYLGVFSFESDIPKKENFKTEFAKAAVIKNNNLYNSEKEFLDVNYNEIFNINNDNFNKNSKDEYINKPEIMDNVNSDVLVKTPRNYSNNVSKGNSKELDQFSFLRDRGNNTSEKISEIIKIGPLDSKENINKNDDLCNKNNINNDSSNNSNKNSNFSEDYRSYSKGKKRINSVKSLNEKEKANQSKISSYIAKMSNSENYKNQEFKSQESKEKQNIWLKNESLKPNIHKDSVIFSKMELEESEINILHEYEKANISKFFLDSNTNKDNTINGNSHNLNSNQNNKNNSQSKESNSYSGNESKTSSNKINNNNNNYNNSMLNCQNTSESTDKIYFDVYFRKVQFSEDNVIYNLILYDITDLINSKIKILEENKKKQKVLAKIAHEFKTPLTSIICLISILKDKIESADSESFIDISHNDNPNNLINNNSNKNNNSPGKKINLDSNHKNKNQQNNRNNRNYNNDHQNEAKILNEDVSNTLSLIQNLSRYVIFLTSDIINYSHPDNINSVKLDFHKIDFQEMSVFCFDILKSLLYCNISKLKKIKTELFYDDNIDSINYYSDQVRIKQILLNFISNSVKFTNEGFINLIFEKQPKENFIKIIVKDSGLGLKDTDKKLLFKEFFKNENIKVNSLNNTNIGSGLGLAICKNLAEKLNMKIGIESEFGKGSEISLIIFLNEKNCETNLNGSIINININDKYNDKENNNLIRSSIGKKNKISNSENKNFSNDLNSSVNENSSKNAISVIKGQSVNNKNVNNQFNISYLDSYFECMENNNFDVLPKKDVDNFYNQIKTERFFNENMFDDISSKNRTSRSNSNLFNTVIDYRASKTGKKDGTSLFKKAEMLNNTVIVNSNTNRSGFNKSLNDIYEEDPTMLHDRSIQILDPIDFLKYKLLLRKHDSKKQLNSSSLTNISNLSSSRNKSQTENFPSQSFRNLDLPRKNIILVADDNHIINDSHKRLLTKIIKQNNLHFEVFECSDGMEILKYVSDENIFHEIKMILTDENMEFLNGSEAIRMVRTIEERKKCERKLIISLTCHEDASIVNNIKKAGADFILTKPLTSNKILPFFNKLL